MTTRIRRDVPEFRELSFNKLRKTAASLVRSKASGEIASVFLCHGSPVGHDELVEVYTNRPYAKVFVAIDEMGESLRQVFDQVEIAFAIESNRSGSKLSKFKIQRIRVLARQGKKVAEIAKEVKVSKATVTQCLEK